MDSVKILHTADLHLGSGRTGITGGKAEIENTFFKIINICKDESVDFLLIAGDLFDTPFVDTDLAERVISAMGQIPETTIAIAPGNHDPACPGSVYLKYSFPENVVIFSSFLEYTDFPEKNVRLWGAGFTDRFEKLSLLQSPDNINPDAINICVLHGEVVAESTSSSYNPIYASAISKSGFDYLALGHIHKRSEILKSGSTYYSYCGCPDGMGFDELGSLGIYIGEISKSDNKLKFLETSSRKYVIESADITECQNTIDVSGRILDRLKQAYGDTFGDNLYRITLTGTLPIDTSISAGQLQSILSGTLHHVEINDQCDADIQHIEAIASETSLRGIFVGKMLDKINSALPEEQIKLKNALKIGLKSFNKGVTLNDN